MSGANKSMNASATSYFIEYVRLNLASDEEWAVTQWAGRFLRAREVGSIEACHQLRYGIKSSGQELSADSRGIILHCEGLLFALLAEWEQAEKNYRRSLALFRQSGNKSSLSGVLNDLGTLHYLRGELSQATLCYREALMNLSGASLSPGKQIESIIRNNLGLVLLVIGNYAEGASELKQAIQLYQQQENAHGEARVKVNLGQLYQKQGKISLALATYQDALQTLRQVGDQRIEQEVLNNLGTLYRYQGDFKKAFEQYEQSLKLAQLLDDLGSQAQALGNLGGIYQLQNKTEQARFCYEEALAFYQMLADRSGEGRMWGNLGHLYTLKSQSDEAKDCYEKGLRIAREINDVASEITALVNVAIAYRNAALYEKAETLYQEALVKARQQQNPRLLDKVLGALGFLRVLQKQWATAETLLQEVLTLQQQRGDLYAQVETIFKLGALAYEQGQYERVLPIVEPAWEIAQRQEYGHWLVKIAELLGDTAFACQDLAGFNYYTTAFVVARQYDDDKNFYRFLALLSDPIADMVKQEGLEQTLAHCDYLLNLWHQEPWYPWTKPAIDHLETVVRALREGNPLPKVR